MGIVNVTPDSFSDGGRFFDPGTALDRARMLIDHGADILDLGGESTRPGAEPVSEIEEFRRVIPLIQAIRGQSDIPISIDTLKPAVARAGVSAGADMWNDVSALGYAPDSMDMAAALGCDVVLMHMQGEPRTMQTEPHYKDVVSEVADFLMVRAELAMARGVAHDRILIDPGIGFGKTLQHNLALMANLDRFVDLGFRVLLGLSRKRFIQQLDETADTPVDRLGGSLAGALAGAEAGCAIVRVHDVRETVQALKVQAAIRSARTA
jgi:dihydropteroate synthase